MYFFPIKNRSDFCRLDQSMEMVYVVDTTVKIKDCCTTSAASAVLLQGHVA